MYQQAQPLLSSPTLDTDSSLADEKDALSPPAYERQVAERKRKHILLVVSLIANAILTISLGALWGSYHNKFSWKGVQPVYSERVLRCCGRIWVLIVYHIQPPSTTCYLMNMFASPMYKIPPYTTPLLHLTAPVTLGTMLTSLGRTYTSVNPLFGCLILQYH